MYWCFTCISVCAQCAYSMPKESRREYQSSWTAVKGGCESPCVGQWAAHRQPGLQSSIGLESQGTQWPGLQSSIGLESQGTQWVVISTYMGWKVFNHVSWTPGSCRSYRPHSPHRSCGFQSPRQCPKLLTFWLDSSSQLPSNSKITSPL